LWQTRKVQAADLDGLAKVYPSGLGIEVGSCAEEEVHGRMCAFERNCISADKEVCEVAARAGSEATAWSFALFVIVEANAVPLLANDSACEM
jgi:hypothetical protein